MMENLRSLPQGRAPICGGPLPKLQNEGGLITESPETGSLPRLVMR